MSDAPRLVRLWEYHDEAVAFLDQAVSDLRDRFADYEQVIVDPQHGLSWRVKSRQAIEAKYASRLGRRPLGPVDDAIINDFLGVRVLVVHLGLVEHAEGLVQKWSADRGLVLRSYTANLDQPKVAGYRAVHMDFEVHDPSVAIPKHGGLEVQITTWLQHLHGVLSHSLIYKAIGPQDPTAVLALEHLSEQLHSIDESLAGIGTA
jgi:ppGpp synthetase/RelA/SpoT-type nucleotidyltranferase